MDRVSNRYTNKLITPPHGFVAMWFFVVFLNLGV